MWHNIFSKLKMSRGPWAFLKRKGVLGPFLEQVRRRSIRLPSEREGRGRRFPLEEREEKRDCYWS